MQLSCQDHFYLKLFVDNYLLNFADSTLRAEINKADILLFFFKRIQKVYVLLLIQLMFHEI